MGLFQCVSVIGAENVCNNGGILSLIHCMVQVVSSYCTVHSDDDVCNGDILSVFQCLCVTGGVVLLHSTQ